MKKIVVNDTNVFIDLFNVGLLEGFFSLPWEIHTTEFVMLELTKEGQHDSVSQYKENGLLHISVFGELYTCCPRNYCLAIFNFCLAILN